MPATPTTSAAPRATPARQARRWRRRLRRLVVDAAWLPFPLVVIVVGELERVGRNGPVHLAVLTLLALSWPIVVVNNVARGRPPRWGGVLHWIVGVANLAMVVLFSFILLVVSHEMGRMAAAAAVIGFAISLGGFVVVAARQRQPAPVPFVAATVATVAMLFVTIGLTAFIDDEMWERIIVTTPEPPATSLHSP